MSPQVRFTQHALNRLYERFGDSVPEVLQAVQEAVLGQRPSYRTDSGLHRFAEFRICGELCRVVFCHYRESIRLLTVMPANHSRLKDCASKLQP